MPVPLPVPTSVPETMDSHPFLPSRMRDCPLLFLLSEVRDSLTLATRHGHNAGSTLLRRSTGIGTTCYGQRRYPAPGRSVPRLAKQRHDARRRPPGRFVACGRRDGRRDVGQGSVGASPARLTVPDRGGLPEGPPIERLETGSTSTVSVDNQPAAPAHDSLRRPGHARCRWERASQCVCMHNGPGHGRTFRPSPPADLRRPPPQDAALHRLHARQRFRK